ncbi:MAG: sensor histidine kinase [Phycisphaerae bacterium]
MADSQAKNSARDISAPTKSKRAFTAQGEFLRSFALQVVLIIAISLIFAGGIAVWIVFNGNRSAVVAIAPRVTESIAAMLSEADVKSSAQLAALGPKIEDIPYVNRIEIEIGAGNSGAPSENPAPPLQYRSPSGKKVFLRTQAPIRNSEGVVVGRLNVEFSPIGVGWLGVAIWTHLGVLTSAALLAYWLLYSRTRRQLRPLEQIQDNLVAFHEGVEPTLDLLTVQDEDGFLSEAWNTFIDRVAALRREVERSRCRTVLASTHDASSAMHRTIVEHLPIGIMRLDDREAVTLTNAAAVTLLNLSRSTGGSQLLAERISDTELTVKILGLRKAMPGSSVDLRIARQGNESVIRVTPMPLSSPLDDMTLLLQDVSQLVQAERSRDEFLVHITHELRTPLTNIRAYVETLSQDFLDDENARRECYNVIMSETRRLSKLIEDVLSVSQIEAGGTRLVRTNVRVEELLRQTAQEMQAAAEAKDIALTLKIPSKVPMVPADRHRLHQVWTNLIGNAIKYTPPNERVSVEVETEGNRLCVRVSDTGIGIPPECHEKIFEKFYRVSDAAVSATEGTGLGLAITREILRIHGGSIRVDSSVGKGSTFIVELPTVKSVENELVGA